MGVEESVGRVCAKVVRDGPYDGVLGFSQGATLATLVCALMASGSPLALSAPPFRMAVLIAGFIPRDAQVLETLAAGTAAGPLPAPRTLWVSGSSDTFVPSQSTERLAQHFASAEWFKHEGGHGIPSGADFRNTVKTFVRAAAG